MKYTSLFSAVAVAAAMGTQAFGTPTAVNTDDFEASAGYEVGSVTNAANTTAWAAKHWTFEGDENDCEIVAGDVTTTGSDSQSLKLGTNGGLASFAAQTTKDYAATVSMKVRMVASDSPVDMSSDTTTQTALYLETTGDGDEATYALKAFAYDNDGGSNTWVTLAAEGFEITADNYDAQVSIVIDYNAGTAVYTVNNTTFDAVALANPNAWGTDKRLNSVAFKGTGFVDDLFVGHEQVGTFATFAYETILDGTTTVKDPGTSVNLDGAAWTTDGYGDVAEAVTGYEYTLKLYSRENGTDTDLNVTLTADAQGQWTVNSSTYASFAEGGTYVVKAEYTKLQLAVTVKYYAGADNTSELLDTVEATVAYGDTYQVDVSEYDSFDEIVDASTGETYDDAAPITAATIINVYGCVSGGSEPTVYTAVTTIAAGSLEFTAFDPVARTASFTFDAAEGYEPVQGDTLATLGVVVANTLDGTQTVVGDVTFSVTEGVGSGTVTLPAAASGETSLFLFGLGDKAATPAAGE